MLGHDREKRQQQQLTSLDPVSSAAIHPTGSVMATCSGQKQYPEFLDEADHQKHQEVTNRKPDEQSYRRSDNSLKIWQL